MTTEMELQPEIEIGIQISLCTHVEASAIERQK